MKNSNKKRRTYSEEDRIDVAQGYLDFGSFRKVEKNMGIPKSTAHQIVRKFIGEGGFISEGGFDRTYMLQGQIFLNRCGYPKQSEDTNPKG